MKNFFDEYTLDAAKKTLERARISISFEKGSLEKSLVTSAIIQDGGSFISRITFKNQEEGKTLVSHCTCSEWNEINHCKHTAALLLRHEKATYSHHENMELQSPFLSNGVRPIQMGEIIDSAKVLRGAMPSSTFSSLQYELNTKKIQHFPATKELRSKLTINLVKTKSLENLNIYTSNENLYSALFSYEDEKDISLFDVLYIFNWKTGEAFNQKPFVQDLVKKIQLEGKHLEINHFMLILSSYIKEDLINLKINDVPFSEIIHEECSFRFKIEQTKNNAYIDFFLEIFDSEEKLITPPEIFSILAHDHGFLNCFRTKLDASNFIKDLAFSLEHESSEYKKHLFGQGKKKLSLWVNQLFLDHDIMFLDIKEPHKIFFLASSKLRFILKTLIQSFSENLVKFSTIEYNEKRVLFKLSKNQLFDSIASFFHKLSILNIPIFYNNAIVKSWSSNIRFERKENNLDWFNIDLLIDEKDLKLIKATDIKGNYYLSHDGLIILEKKEQDLLKFMKKYTQFDAEKGELEGKKESRYSLTLKRSRIFELFELKKLGIEGALTKEEEKLCNDLLSLSSMPIYEVPKRYEDLARAYQIEGYQWLRFLYEHRFGACLADDMGLGKTLQTIIFLQSIISKVERVLIVCPVSIILNWEYEISKYSDLDVFIYYGNERKLETNSKVILTSYGVLKKEAFTTFNDISFDILVMDEVQNLKNIKSLGANSARNIKSLFRICLTGTPVENDLSEFYNIMDLSIPGIWGDSKFLSQSSTKATRLLAKNIAKPFILRRTKDQVLKELPTKEEHHVYLNFSEEEKEFYKKELLRIRQDIDSAQASRKYGEVLKSLLRLRQLCLWQSEHQSTKIDYLLESLEQIIGEKHKVLVFSQFTTYLDLIQNKLKVQGYKIARIDGSLNFKKRASEIERFQEGDAEIFLISLKAGGVGLNLTAASYIFLMDPWWNPAVENQAIDRAYRIGQDKKLTVYRPIIKDTVEEKVLILQNVKKELFTDLMNFDDDSFHGGKLTMEDFKMLLS